MLSTRQLKPNGQCTLCRLGVRSNGAGVKEQAGNRFIRAALFFALSTQLALSEWRLGAAFVCQKNGALSSLAKLDVLLEI